MSYVFPESIGRLVEYEFLHSLGIFAAQDIVTIHRPGGLISSGNFMHIQRPGQSSDPQRRDISTTSATRSFTEMSNLEEKGVLLHDDKADAFPLGNATFAGMDFQEIWARQTGLMMARRAKQQLYRVAKAAVEVCDTTDGSTASADIHISDQYSATVNQTMTFTRLQDARAKMGDAAGLLTVAVMHSTPWNNLVKDGIGNYKIDTVAGRLINEGGVYAHRTVRQVVRESLSFMVATCEALGMIIIIDDDMSSIAMTGTTYTYKTKYETLLFGPGAMTLAYQRAPEPFYDNDIKDARGVTRLMRAELDYCVHLNGVGWNVTTVNPTDTQLGTKSNWDEVYTDHKQVKCVKLITNG